MTLLPGLQLSHYRLIEKLGEGGMGIVWKALDTRLDREIAVKFLPEHLATDPGRLARFEREARAVAALNHPNIVTIHSVEEVEGRRFLTLELVQGRTLDRLIPDGGMPLPLLLRIASPLVRAVAAAHERGLAHRDLKPANVMVTDDGRVKVLDFGLAGSPRPRPVPDSQATTRSGEGGFGGTLSYMSPEQMRGIAADQRSDVFALGSLLYEMACGRRPFAGGTAADLVAAVLRDAPRPIGRSRPDLPPELGSLVEACLQKDPDHRPASAGEMQEIIERMTRSAALPREEFPASIAVLPFTDLSPDGDQAYLCEGIAEEILAALAQTQGLRVASRAASFPLRAAGLTGKEIGHRLRVASLLEGSVRRSGDRLRITVELTDAASGRQLWFERYDREAAEIFTIEDEIAHRVVHALQLTQRPDGAGVPSRLQTTDVPAYLCYLRGRKFYFEYRRRSIEFAQQMFQSAIAHDPGYALAYAGLADCAAFLYFNGGRRDEDRERAEAASLRALQLGGDLAVVHASRALALTLFDRHAEADAEFEAALRLDPLLFEAYYFNARAAFARGQLERAARLYERASEVRPEDYQAPLLVGQIYSDLGRPFAAEAARRRGVRIAEERLELNPDDARAHYMAANGLVALGERERGLEACRRAIAIDPDDPMLLYNVACIRSLAGEVDGALEALEKGVRSGLLHREWLLMDSNLDPLRSHPRYEAILGLMQPR